jgi:hypothetical protein
MSVLQLPEKREVPAALDTVRIAERDSDHVQ